MEKLLPNTFLALGITMGVGALGLRRFATRVRLDSPGRAGRPTLVARRTLWVAVGVLVPLYIFYCLSVEGARTPDQLLLEGITGREPTWDWSAWAGAGLKVLPDSMMAKSTSTIRPVDVGGNFRAIREAFGQWPAQWWGVGALGRCLCSASFGADRGGRACGVSPGGSV
ncbi:MAG: hypothetical protein QM770_00535 [Tepidisphaeraceae bacterium]